MILTKKLTATNPESQTDEVAGFLSEQGLNPDNLLYRIFNSDEIDSILSRGTDRSGNPKKRKAKSDYITPGQSKSDRPFYEEMGASSWDEMLGYDKELHKRGLSRQDGLWCGDIDSLRKNLNPDHDVVVPGKVGIAVYDPSKLVEVGVEFYAFRDPIKKRNALVAVVSNQMNASEAYVAPNSVEIVLKQYCKQ